MRIACIHLPQFPLQVAVRESPSLRGRPVAIVGGVATGTRALGAPVVIACSRAARALGVRLGMTAPTARALSDDLAVIAVEPEALAAASCAVGDALLELAPRVDRGGDPRGSHHAAYAQVPAGTRGASFGARVIGALEAAGFLARIGIADDRFTGWVAASQASDEDQVVMVPRGGSAAFLAPMPLSLLAIPPEVQHVLGALGVHTLGEFAALPPPSVARAWDADYQQLARGESGAELDDYIGAHRAMPEPAAASPLASARPGSLDLVLTSPVALRHRHGTRRGKHRPRIHTPAAQARLFGD
jgi:protein ImuB